MLSPSVAAVLPNIPSDLKDVARLSQAKSNELLYIWVTKLQAHRLYKKNEAAHVHSGFIHTLSHGTTAGLAQRNGDLVTIASAATKFTQHK